METGALHRRFNVGFDICMRSQERTRAQVWRFILEREVEAPERFQAIQSYRATMAVLRQQALFVKQLFDTGVVDDLECSDLLGCAPGLGLGFR